MTRKYWHWLWIGIFTLFGLVQYNDPDFYIWMPIYFFIAVIAWLYLQNSSLLRWLPIPIVIYTAITISYLPDLYQWIATGMSSIADSMKTDSPHIELTREFFGVTLCLVTLITYYFLTNKKQL